MGDFVRLEVADGIGTIRLDRPPVNALNDQVTADLAAAASAADDSEDVRAVIQVAPDDSVYTAALDLVRRYAAGPALALRAAKQAIDYGLGVDLATGLEIERTHFAALFGTEDQRACMRSFLEKTQPAFTGR